MKHPLFDFSLRHTLLTATFAAGILMILGCNSSTPIPTATEPASIVASPIHPTEEAPAPSEDQTSNNKSPASFDNIRFDYDTSLAQTVAASMNPGYTMHDFQVPDYVKFDLVGYPTESNGQPPRVEIYPVAEYIASSTDIQNDVEQLKKLLAEKPTTLPNESEIPVLALFDARQVMQAQIEYLTFQNGYGMRFITEYVQMNAPITNSRIFYVFQGFTNDDQYYVVAIFPVSSSTLPDSEQNLTQQQRQELMQKLQNNFVSYVEEITQQLNNLQPQDFMPNLSLLDALAQSLSIKQ